MNYMPKTLTGSTVEMRSQVASITGFISVRKKTKAHSRFNEGNDSETKCDVIRTELSNLSCEIVSDFAW